MKIAQRTLMGIGALALIGWLMNLVAPKAVHAAAAALIVDVANTPAKAVPTVAAPAASQLYSSSCAGAWNGGSILTCAFDPPPAGKTLFIETVSIGAGGDSGAVIYQAGIIPSGGSSLNAVFIPLVQQSAGDGPYFVGSAAVRLWAAAGETPYCLVQLFSNSTLGGMQCHVSGYLAPAQ